MEFLWYLAALLVVLWVICFAALKFATPFVNLLLVVALMLVVVRLVRGQRVF